MINAMIIIFCFIGALFSFSEFHEWSALVFLIIALIIAFHLAEEEK
jgi:uncharacterized membrane protein